MPGIDDYLKEQRDRLRRLGEANSPVSPKPKERPKTRQVRMTPSGRRRAGSVGVSSTARHRKRGSAKARAARARRRSRARSSGAFRNGQY